MQIFHGKSLQVVQNTYITRHNQKLEKENHMISVSAYIQKSSRKYHLCEKKREGVAVHIFSPEPSSSLGLN